MPFSQLNLLKNIIETADTIVVKPVSGPYYRWADLRQYYKNKIKEVQQQLNLFFFA